jgi:hypothetical protein
MPAFLFGMLYNFRRMAILISNISINNSLKKIITKISDLTLDIYIVQMILINLLMPKIPFPINVAIIFILILIAAFINNWIANRISKNLIKVLKYKH